MRYARRYYARYDADDVDDFRKFRALRWARRKFISMRAMRGIKRHDSAPFLRAMMLFER